MTKNTKILLLAIFLLGLFLRLYKLDTNLNFSPEVGDNLLDIKNAIVTGSIPLTGPATSHPWLLFGPLYYWILSPLLLIFRFNPLVPFYFGAAGGSLLILLNYFVVNKISNSRVALFSSVIISISPLWVEFSRNARFFFFVTILVYLLIYLLYKFYKEKEKNAILPGLIFGAGLSFHYSIFILLPVCLFIIFKYSKKDKMLNLSRFIFGGVLINLPLIIYDAQSGFKMLINFAAWAPYRFLGFFGILPKNNFSLQVTLGDLEKVAELFGKSLGFEGLFWVFIFLGVVSYLYNKVVVKKTNDLCLRAIAITLVLSIAVIIIHGDIPLHYLLPMFPIPAILFGYIASDISNNKFGKEALVIFITFATFFNFKDYFKEPIYSLIPHFVPYSKQIDLTRDIIKIADGKNFTLKRIGPFDHFEENFSQNYRYLLWYFGNEPVYKSDLEFTIHEKGDGVSFSQKYSSEINVDSTN